uniref:Coagulation factor XIII, A1 polypeptide b n=1 Tax=Sinocyclocheilus rhinocerous TaxID=307959 RepID=A0A673GZL0_9TELE
TLTPRQNAAGAKVSSNQQEGKVEEFEPFMLLPRGPPSLKEFLDIWDVDVLKRPQEINKQGHHTHLYSSDFLIVRRAQEFQIKITFDRPYKPAQDKFAVEFVIGESLIQVNLRVFFFLARRSRPRSPGGLKCSPVPASFFPNYELCYIGAETREGGRRDTLPEIPRRCGESTVPSSMAEQSAAMELMTCSVFICRNYHCWNECFMARSDLPPGFGGWQCCGRYAAGLLSGMFRCGPASVAAIKHSQICYPFDAPFVFAEVNSDVIFLSKGECHSRGPHSADQSRASRWTSVHITDQYKFPEGERRAPCFKNCSKQRRTGDVYVTGTAVYYTGVPSAKVVFKTPKVKLDPLQSKEEKVLVRGEDYMHKLVEQFKETGQIITAMKVITMDNPKLIVKITGSPRVSEEMYVSVEFTNAFKFNLENVDLRMEGPGIMPFKRKQYSLIAPGTSITWTETFSPRRAGSTKLIASLDFAALRQVYGETELTIQH